MELMTASDHVWNAATRSAPSPRLTEHVRSQWDRVTEYASKTQRLVLETARRAYEDFNSSQTLSIVRSALGKINKRVTVERIMELTTLDQIRHAPVIMQRYLVANPTVRKMYNQQSIDGWAGSYMDCDPGTIGDDHYDYRRATDCMFIEKDGRMQLTRYFDDLRDGDAHLSFQDKCAVLMTWSATDALLAAQQDDPTSPVGEML